MRKIEGVDAEIEYLRKCLNEARQQLQLAEKEKEEKLRSIEREKQLEFEREKLEMKLEYEKKSEEFKKGKQGESNGSHAKLPKLSIPSLMELLNNGFRFGINSARKLI